MHQTTSKFAKYHVHLSKTEIQNRSNQSVCEATFSLLASELMQEIAPMISLKSEVKFVLASLKYDPMIKNNVEHYKTLIREQNTYLTNYVDFRIGGVSKAMLNVDVSGKTAQDNILMSPFIVDMHPTVYTDSKGIWTIESTVEDLHKVLQDVKTCLSILPSVVPDKYFETYSIISSIL